MLYDRCVVLVGGSGEGGGVAVVCGDAWVVWIDFPHF